MAKIKGPIFCPNCGHEGKGKNYTAGSFGVEIILWLFLLIPGLIYSIWRLTTTKVICPQCGNENIIPLSAKDNYLKMHAKE